MPLPSLSYAKVFLCAGKPLIGSLAVPRCRQTIVLRDTFTLGVSVPDKPLRRGVASICLGKQSRVNTCGWSLRLGLERGRNLCGRDRCNQGRCKLVLSRSQACGAQDQGVRGLLAGRGNRTVELSWPAPGFNLQLYIRCHINRRARIGRSDSHAMHKSGLRVRLDHTSDLDRRQTRASRDVRYPVCHHSVGKLPASCEHGCSTNGPYA